MVEISDQRMSDGLLGGARIFRLPSNAELGKPDDWYIYGTKPFPAWSLCLNSTAHTKPHGVLYHADQCPVCGVQGRRRQEAIRFVRACPGGHMDDVEWSRIVHSKGYCGHHRWFWWRGGGGALSQVEIECPQCGQKANLGDAYGREWPCSGRFPEREPLGASPERPGCSRPSVIVQRQASNLRIPELRTLFTIPPRHTDLHEKLSLTPIRAVLAVSPPGSLAVLSATLQKLEQQHMIGHDAVTTILAHPWEEIQQAVTDVSSSVPNGLQDLLSEEFHALIHASVHGVPYSPSGAANRSVVFEVNPARVRRFRGQNGRVFRVVPVSRLQTVTVQIGYRREVERSTTGGQTTPAQLVSVSFTDSGGQEWYPGVKFLGEGVFVMLDEKDGQHFPMYGKSVNRWLQAYRSSSTYDASVFRDTQRSELHPAFVWWHTLAHALIVAISLSAGYSSTSIRERIFLEVGTNTDRVRGGLILYTAHPGSDGSLGGLLALVPRFDDILRCALEHVRFCSNDPLCLEERFEPGKYGGAACYGCVLASETSCEHRNLWLDREVVLDNLP